MDSGLVSDSLSDDTEGSGGKSATTPLTTYEEKFNELFPLYLCMGMTEEQYWDKDCSLVIYYRKADEMKQERHNQELWLQGRYIYDALCLVSPILHAFAKKGTKPKPYLSEPYSFAKAQTETQEESKAKKVYDKGKRFMEKFLADTNKKFDKPDE